MARFSDLGHDLVDHILTYLPTFDMLAAAICTSKGVYNVFAAHPNSIVYAVAGNVAGHPDAVPAFVRLIRAQHIISVQQDAFNPELDLELPEPDPGAGEAEVMKAPIRRTEMAASHWWHHVVSRLEDLFSWRHKDRTSSTSRLTYAESRRFHLAMYRFWLYADVYGPSDDYPDDEPPDHSQLRIDFLLSYTLPELYDIARAAAFIAEMLEWVDRGAGPSTPVSYAVDHFRTISSVGPWLTYQAYEDFRRPNVSNYEEGFFWNAYNGALDRLGVSAEQREKQFATAILAETVGEKDECSRCHVVHGLKLRGAPNWHFLQGEINQRVILSLLPGGLRSNKIEIKLIEDRIGLSEFLSRPCNYTRFMAGIFDMQDAQENGWDKDQWYCIDCIRELLREYFWRWWRLEKERSGLTTKPDCWYGYQCRTMTHKVPHAEKLNHLCVPTRGDNL